MIEVSVLGGPPNVPKNQKGVIFWDITNFLGHRPEIENPPQSSFSIYHGVLWEATASPRVALFVMKNWRTFVEKKHAVLIFWDIAQFFGTPESPATFFSSFSQSSSVYLRSAFGLKQKHQKAAKNGLAKEDNKNRWFWSRGAQKYFLRRSLALETKKHWPRVPA